MLHVAPQSQRPARPRFPFLLCETAKENEALTAEQHSRESIRIARVTRELLKKFAAAFRMFQAQPNMHQVKQRANKSKQKLMDPITPQVNFFQ